MNKLQQLEATIANALAEPAPDPAPWVPRRPGVDHDVLIVGAGQSGTTAAFALRRRGITATIIDAEAEGCEGVWLHRARMPTLRTPKDRPGPELGVSPLSFKSWYTACHNAAAYAGMERIPRTLWAEYLAWFRRTLQLPVRFETRLRHVATDGPNLRVTLENNGATSIETTRKLVLANGLVGGGTRNIPPLISDNLPFRFYAHTNDPIDFGQLRGKRVAVLGASASGFDAAATALENGAASARLFCRAPDLARGTRFRWADYPGADYFHLLPDLDRWRVAKLYLDRGNHPPPSSIARVSSLAGFTLHLGAPWQQIKLIDDRIRIGVPGEALDADYVIAATGFRHDPRHCQELSEIASGIALWQDRFTPPPGEAAPHLSTYPYLGPEFQYQEKQPGSAPNLNNIHVLNTAALLSHLRIVGDIKCLGYTSEKLAEGIVRDLFLADRQHHIEQLSSPIRDELTGEEYAALIWRREPR